jgi:MFS family permease
MKFRSITIFLIAEVAAMSLWFVSAAIMPDMLREVDLSPARQAALSSGVQAGFVIGALASAILGLADRFDPRRLFAVSAIGAGLINLVLLFATPGSAPAILARVATGALLAGVYPVGMKIIVGWGDKDRGFLVGILVGALTLGTASPHLIVLTGGSDWRVTVVAASVASILAGLAGLLIALGPHHSIAPRFNPKVIASAWTNRRVRLAYAGYLGHMWELYAMWAWVGTAVTVSYSATMAPLDAEWFARLTAFVAIAAGGIGSIVAGKIADRIGKAEVTIIAMALSGGAAVATAATFGGAVWLTFAIVIVWGATVIADSAQFSALVADASPADQVGSLMTFQTALGFALTFVTVQITPYLASQFGWPLVIAGMALGPTFGIAAMAKLRTMG